MYNDVEQTRYTTVVYNDNMEILIYPEKLNIKRVHPLKLNKNQVGTDLRQHFFSKRVINTWNKLDSDIVCSSSLNIFKNHLERLHKEESFIGLSGLLDSGGRASPLGRPHPVSYLVS